MCFRSQLDGCNNDETTLLAGSADLRSVGSARSKPCSRSRHLASGKTFRRSMIDSTVETKNTFGCNSRSVSMPFGSFKDRLKLGQGTCFMVKSSSGKTRSIDLSISCKHVFCLFLAAIFAITSSAEIENDFTSDGFGKSIQAPSFPSSSTSMLNTGPVLQKNAIPTTTDNSSPYFQKNTSIKLTVSGSSIGSSINRIADEGKIEHEGSAISGKNPRMHRKSNFVKSESTSLQLNEVDSPDRKNTHDHGPEELHSHDHGPEEPHSHDHGPEEPHTEDDTKLSKELELLNALKIDRKPGPAEKESRYFIHRLFQRYGDEEYLLVPSLKKLLEQIGLAQTLSTSDDHRSKDLEHSHDHGSNTNINHVNDNDMENKNSHIHTRSIQFRNDLSQQQLLDVETHSSDLTLKKPRTEQAYLSTYLSIRPKQNVQTDSSKIYKRKTSLQRQKRSVSDSHDHHDHNHCLSTNELLHAFQFDHLKALTTEDFFHLCPALIDQLDRGYCHKETSHDHGPKEPHSHDHGPEEPHSHDHGPEEPNSHDHGPEEPHSHSHNPHGHEDEEGHSDHDTGSSELHTKAVPAKVWFSAFLSVAVISICSVAGLVVIPNMKRTFYNHILQFLVALAVGTMSGDALLHLLPHALSSETHHGDHHHSHLSHAARNKTADKNDLHLGSNEDGSSHDSSAHLAAMYKGLVALMGVYCFFFVERLFTLFTKNQSGRKKRRSKNIFKKGRGHTKSECRMVTANLQNGNGNVPSCDEMVMVVHPNKALKAYADASHEAYLHRCDESLIISPSGQAQTPELANGDQALPGVISAPCSVGLTLEGIDLDEKMNNSDTPLRETALISDAEIMGPMKETDEATGDEGHGHSHSHMVQDFKGPFSSVAMMVVVGDMIHNFCDGLAIGAAFAGSMAGGLSTSVAVFCHELPHEIGDFAVLVRSGLTVKKAIFYNLLSSIPCFIGALIGLGVGNLGSTTSWIFAAVGGMFLYITLVDLVPEMTSVYTKCGEPWFLHLLLQASGMALGTTIMIIISVSEESLLIAFQD